MNSSVPIADARMCLTLTPSIPLVLSSLVAISENLAIALDELTDVVAMLNPELTRIESSCGKLH